MVTKRVTTAMMSGEPIAGFRRATDPGKALAPASDDDMGLPLASPPSVPDTIIGLVYPGPADDGSEA